MGPGILGVRVVGAGQIGGQSFQIVRQGGNRPYPVLQVFRPAKPEKGGNVIDVGSPPVVESLKESYKGSVRGSWGPPDAPEIRLAEFLRDHLEIMELMARSRALSA